MKPMTADQEVALFAQINANNPRFMDWLDVEMASVVKYLTKARDPVTVHQAQGAAQFIEKLKDLLVAAQKQP